MTPRPRRVALFGGTFDPIHRGHMAAAQAALDADLVDELVFIPAGDPPHKPAGAHQPREQRWCMAVLATLTEPRCRVARWEIDRAGKSYAVDTVREAIADYAARGETPEFHWVIGTDAMALIDTWRDAPTLFQLTKFLVIARSGFTEAGLREHLATTVPWAPADALRFIAMPHVDVSSTDLRRRMATGESAADGLPDLVATYIGRYGLYRAPVGSPGGVT